MLGQQSRAAGCHRDAPRLGGLSLTVNSIGGRSDDGQVANQQYLSDWNPIWNHAVGRFEGGWTVEVALPFRSIRYQSGSELFVVYNDERDTRLSGFPEISTRAFIVKVNRLFRF